MYKGDHISKVTVYKAIKAYKGDNLIDDLTFALYISNLDVLYKGFNEATNTPLNISSSDYTKSFNTGNYKIAKQNALNYLRIFKVVRFKVKCKRIKICVITD